MQNSDIWDGWFIEKSDRKCCLSKLVIFELIEIRINDINFDIQTNDDLLDYEIHKYTEILVTPRLQDIFKKYEIIKDQSNIFIGRTLRFDSRIEDWNTRLEYWVLCPILYMLNHTKRLS